MQCYVILKKAHKDSCVEDHVVIHSGLCWTSRKTHRTLYYSKNRRVSGKKSMSVDKNVSLCLTYSISQVRLPY